jgi:hypothetical protein
MKGDVAVQGGEEIADGFLFGEGGDLNFDIKELPITYMNLSRSILF